MRNVGIDFISVFGLPPVQFVELAAELGCSSISLGMNRMEYNPECYAPFSLREDKALRREVKAALVGNGIELALGENLPVMAGVDGMDDWRASLDILCEMGAKRINSISLEPDFGRNVDEYGRLAELCAEYGVIPLIEFIPIVAISSLSGALAVIEKVGAPNLGLIIDTMHCGRSGVTGAELAAVPVDRIGYVQLCDAPLIADLEYMDEAVHERQVPGEGGLPLRDYLAALARDVVVSVEVPQRSLAEAGQGPKERLAHCVAQGRAMLASL